MKNQLLSLLISVLILVSHIHFRPIGTSLFVFARFIVFNSLPAFFLSVVLDFAVEAVLPIPVTVVSVTGVVSIAVLPWSLGLVSIPTLESVVPPVLECSDLILDLFVILDLGLTVILDGRNGLRGF
jgi:hypothetical protein